MKFIKKKAFKLACMYCSHYRNAKKRKKDMTLGRAVTYTRKCAIIKKYITSTHKVCSKFDLYYVFWCNKRNSWMYISACINREKKEVKGCIRCKQGKEIRRIEKEFGNGKSKSQYKLQLTI